MSNQAFLYLTAARAFAEARWRMRMLRTRAAIDAYQSRRLTQFLRHIAHNIPYFAGKPLATLNDLPEFDKAALMANFAQMNVARISAEEVRAALAKGAERIGTHIIGQSTGTSGNRGYYIISEAERFVWLGTLLAKALPDALWRRYRVALAMPGLSQLYQSATKGSRIQLGFFDLARGLDEWAGDLKTFAPDTIVAPPRVLRALATRDCLPATNIFSGAEVLDDVDRYEIESRTGQRVRQIYMATEGLFGVSCVHGSIHLAEDAVHFEWRSVPDAPHLKTPLVTDFTRRAQALVRYRMNDLLELSADPCPCGSAFQRVHRIEGRADDLFALADPHGQLRTITPDVLRNAIVDADASINDYRVEQTAANAILVRLPAQLPPAIDEKVIGLLQTRLALACVAPEISIARGIDAPVDRKLRRIQRLWWP